MSDTQLDRAQVGTHMSAHKPLTKWPDCRQLGESGLFGHEFPSTKTVAAFHALNMKSSIGYGGMGLTAVVVVQPFSSNAQICVCIPNAIP